VHGGSSVSFFFVLSGFILAFTYAGAPGPIDRRRFWVARFARIYPVYVLAIVVALPRWMASGRFAQEGHAPLVIASTLIVVLLLVQSWNWSIANAVNGPAWSLSAEAFFYAIFPWVAERVRRLGTRNLVRVAALAWVSAVVVALALDVTLLPVARRTSTMMAISNLLTPETNPAIRSLEFVFGVACGCLFLRLLREQRIERSRRGDLVAVVSAAGIVAAYAALPPRQVVHNGLLAPLYMALIFSAAMEAPLVRALFGNRLMVLLGEASYAFYLLHTPMMWGYASLARRAMVPAPDSVSGFTLRTAAIVVVSCAVFLLFEQPARRAIRRSLSIPAPQQEDAAVGSGSVEL
jgi:peptidoglycan/LPS O-acetylase OafA/YrhL